MSGSRPKGVRSGIRLASEQRSQVRPKDEKWDPVFWATKTPSLPPLERAPGENAFVIRTEKGARSATIILAGNLGDMSRFGVEARLVGPAGPGAANLDSTIPSPSLRVVRDGFFMLLEIANPNPGEWRIIVRGQPGAGQFQTGNVTVLPDNPNVDLFTSLDRHFVIDAPAKPVLLRATPIYLTTLRQVDLLKAVVKHPDRSLHPTDLASSFDTGGSDDYSGLIKDMPFVGMYEVRVVMRTGPKAFNDPGESIFATAPSNKVAVPVLERTSVEYFFVTRGRRVCRSGNPRDCDGDGCIQESRDNDADKDGTPDAYDGDTDNDEVPDSVECRDKNQDPDKDGLPNALDPDSDGDGINDGQDSTRLGSRASGKS